MAGRSSTLWLALAIIVVGAVAVYFFLQRLRVPAPPPPPPVEVPEVTEVREGVPYKIISPEVETLEELEEYIGDQPLPPVEPKLSKYGLPRPLRPFDNPDEHIRGNRDAVISLVEYTDLTNPYAKLMHSELQKLIEERTDVQWIFRHYPLSLEVDFPAAYIGECVYRQGGHDAFWQYVDLAFEEGLESEDDALNLAESAGADRDAILGCLEEEDLEIQEEVRLDRRDLELDALLFTTPSFFFLNNETGEIRWLEGATRMRLIEIVLDTMQ